MKKVIALIVIVLVYIGCAYAISYNAESALHNYANQLSTLPAYEAELSDFQHGLFSSSARFEIDVDTDLISADLTPEQREQLAPVIEALEEGLPFQVDIFQGPLVFHKGLFAGLFKAEFSLSNEVGWAQNLRDSLQRDSIMDNELRMGFTGQGKGYLRMDPFREGDNVFGGMQIDYQLINFGRHVSAQGEISPSTFSNPEGTLQLGMSRFSSTGDLSDDFINDSHLELHISSIEALTEGLRLFRLNDLELYAEARIDEDNAERFSSQYRLAIDGIEGDGLAQPITGIHLEMALLNLDRQAFDAFYQHAVTSADMEDPFAAQMLMIDAFSGLLEGEPQLHIERFSFEQGADISLALSGTLSFAAGSTSVAQNPFMLLNQLILDMDLSFTPELFATLSESYIDNQLADIGMDPTFIEQMRAQQLNQYQTILQQLVQSGMIAFDGEHYSIVLAMENGQLSVNDNPMPLPF